MQNIPGRMQYLRNAEALCALALPAMFCSHWQKSADPAAWDMRGVALALVSYILLQGAGYWHLKLQMVVRHQPMPAYFQPLYRFFKYSNFVAMAAVAIFITIRGGSAATLADLAWSYGLLAFALLEQINYYYLQLMYDSRAAFSYLRRNGRLRKAALGLDLQRQK